MVTHPSFAKACVAAFAMLVERHGFDPPLIESVGRETYVRYQRGDQTVSVAIEPGSPPIVELFYPSAENGERPVPWAEQNGVQRSRRIPDLDVGVPFVEGNAQSLVRYLEASAAALGRVERAWLGERPARKV